MTDEEIDKDKIRMTIIEFASEMQTKMFKKYDEGKRDWDDFIETEEIEANLAKNLIENDWIDVANLAMILHRFQQQEKAKIDGI
jgi:hypothetical protein